MNNVDADEIIKAIDDAWVDHIGDGRRYHLGASILGKECPRAIYYDFRWFHVTKHSGRMLRLFNRGHDEEARVVKWLRMIGAVVGKTGKEDGQDTFSIFGGILGGSGDAFVENLEKFNLPGRGLFECKTSGDKAFKVLMRDGLVKAKREHFVQMQLYMHHFGYKWGLYVTVNKNDDHLYVAVVPYHREMAEQYTQRGRNVLLAQQPPAKISEDPTWWKCRMCDHKRICHEHAQIAKSCRSCKFCHLLLDEEANTHRWHCGMFRQDIPKDFTYQGCDNWDPIDNA